MPNAYPQPLSGTAIPRFAEMATFMRLPICRDAQSLDIGLVGVPWDGGTTNRAGARHGPREIRNMSTMIRQRHPVTKVCPYDLCRIAVLGDAPVNPIGLSDALDSIAAFFGGVHRAGCIPLSAGGDRLITLPILRAIAGRRPVSLIQFDAHADTNFMYFGCQRFTHGT